jgi:uncharacterized protein (DUF58 family)
VAPVNAAASAAVSPEVLGRVRRLEITARRLVDEVFAGRYNSTFKGRGMEFSEVREYLPGDDVRSIDWNVTARAGRPFVKKFTEERELTVLFLVDTSLSQSFGSRGRLKSELAAEVAAVLAFSALRNGDKAGMILFSDRVEKFIPPRKGRAHALRLIREALAARAAGRGTSLAGALDFLNRVQRRRAVAFLLSDFLDGGYEKTLRVTLKRHDLIAVPVSDPWEAALPRGARLLLEDAETGEPAVVKSPVFDGRGRLPALRKDLARFGADAVFVETDAPYVKAFLSFFRERAKRYR